MRLISRSQLLYQLYSAVNEQGCFNHVKAWYHVTVIEFCLLEKNTFKKNILNNIHFNHFHLIFLSAWMCMCGFKKGLVYCYTCSDLIFAFTKFFSDFNCSLQEQRWFILVHFLYAEFQQVTWCKSTPNFLDWISVMSQPANSA